MICPDCKKNVGEESEYCKYCGYHFSSSPITNLLLRGLTFSVIKIEVGLVRLKSSLSDFYYQSLAKTAVQKSKYMRQDPEQRNLFKIKKVFKRQKDRIDTYINEALQRGYVDYIEGWQSHKVGDRKFIVSYRFVEPSGNFKFWYWIVNFNDKTVREITRKATELEKFGVQPCENTAFVELSSC